MKKLKADFFQKLLFSVFTKKLKTDLFENLIIFKKLSKYIKIDFFFNEKIIFYSKKAQTNALIISFTKFKLLLRKKVAAHFLALCDYNQFSQYLAPHKFPNLPTPTVISFHQTRAPLAFTSSEPFFSHHKFKATVQHPFPIGAHRQHHHPFCPDMPLPSYFISLFFIS